MRQRVAVARALMRGPELLLLDEPYAGLDAGAKELVDDMITEAAREERTVVLATHDPGRGSMAGRTVFLDGGRIVPAPPAEGSGS
jgi:ABC-type multidrug transport system ATPase subunit